MSPGALSNIIVAAKLSKGFHKSRPSESTVVSAILVALLWAQLAIAEHCHDHALDDSSHACGICQQLDSGDTVLADSARTRSIRPAALSETAGATVVSTEPFPHFSARASP